MMVNFAKSTCIYYYVSIFIVLIMLSIKVTGRFLRSGLITDGTNNYPAAEENHLSSFLYLRGINADPEQHCEQMYGFLPCSETLLGHFFLIVVYEYLLFHGESYVASGGKRIFQILGPGIFGASAFQVLGFLPESLILLVSGLSNTKDVAQEYVLTGVGLLAGSAILLLTVIWGTCVIIASRKFSLDSGSSLSLIPLQNRYQKLLSVFTGSGIITDEETSYAAKSIIISVMPIAVLLIQQIFFGMPHGYIFLIPLIVSVMLLIIYFTCQVCEPSLQKRRLAYVKHEHLIVDILKHLQEYYTEQILTEDGSVNLPVIQRLFTKIDEDGDNYISFPEMKKLLQDIKFTQLTWSREKRMEEIIKEFDKDGDTKVTKDEFVEIFKKWLDEIKNAVDKRPYRSIRSWKDLYKILQPWVQTKKKEEEMMKILISEIIRHVQSFPLGNFYNEDGTTNISAIKRLFERIDLDKDNFVSQLELKKLIMELNSKKLPEDVDEAVAKIMQDLDTSGDQQIDEQEFIDGFKEWLNTSNYELIPRSPRRTTDASPKPWERWIDDEDGVDRSSWAWTKAIMLLVLGIAMLALLAEPLIHSVQNVSSVANIPSFFISFVLVPLATNARAAISAIKTASKRNELTTSLTFSELYYGVFMNNVLGFSVLLAVIFFRGLAWDFSAEILVVLLVSIIMGMAASFRSKFHIWTSFIAYMLYPLSLIFVYLFNRF